jgi:excisionase family DNA binding protein
MAMGWVPISTAAKVLGVSRQRVYQLIDEEKVGARKVDGTVLVSAVSLEQRMRSLAKEGLGDGIDW